MTGGIVWPLLAFFVTWSLTPLVRRLALRLGAVDIPGSRKVHHLPVPTMGGLAIFVGFGAVLLFTWPWPRPVLGLALGGVLVVLLGIWDDCRELSPRGKLLGQVAAALVMVALGVKVDFVSNPFDGMIFLGFLAVPATVLWVVGITNALNLIDGLDGLAAGTAAIAALSMGIVAWMEGQMVVALYAFSLAACALAFLRYNFSPARIFMGDTGSMFLGLNLAGLAVLGFTKTTTVLSLLVPVIILGWPIVDTFWAIVRRYHHRQSIFAADKQHLHHQLLNLGLSQRQAVTVIYVLNGCLGAAAVLVNVLSLVEGIVLLLVLFTLVAVGCYLVRAAGRHSPSSEVITRSVAK